MNPPATTTSNPITDYNIDINNEQRRLSPHQKPSASARPTRADNGELATTIINSRRQPAAAIISNPRQPCQHQQSQNQRAKFTKSKSSPSSLTTHKFGLRPTPSPPRLIIDHQTGDIIESYPENPVYLRTYQPIEGDDDEVEALNINQQQVADDDGLDEDDDDTVRDLADESFASSSNVHKQQQKPSTSNSSSLVAMSSDKLNARPNQSHQHYHNTNNNSNHRYQKQQQQIVPPPHAPKVYFAPPATSNNLFDQPVGSLAFQPPHIQPQPQPPLNPSPSPSSSSRERARASFRRALNQLTDAERTDIAIVTEPDDYDRQAASGDASGGGSSSTTGKPHGQMRVTATSAQKGNALLAQQQKFAQTNASKLYGPAIPTMRVQSQKLASPIQTETKRAPHDFDSANGRPPALEDFSLYNLCYNFRVLLVLLLSGLIIYLLAGTLHVDCARYRPTYTYVSIISSSVNLIFIVIFTLFWYCSEVSRTLYQNISASAFMVTIYSILVCVNLSLAILFFFIDTCANQKLMATHSSLADMERFGLIEPPPPLGDLGAPLESSYAITNSAQYNRQRLEARMALEAIDSIERLLDEMEASSRKRVPRFIEVRRYSKRHTANDDGDDPNVLDDQLGDPEQPPPPQTTTTTQSTTTQSDASDGSGYHMGAGGVPRMSPIEAVWEYVKEQGRAFSKSFQRFLMKYDLKFVGALHAMLAACFQYLAIKVAVVRSYFTSRGLCYGSSD